MGRGKVSSTRPRHGRENTVSPSRLFSVVRRDMERYFQLDSRDGAPRLREKLRIVLDSPGLQAVLVHRFGSWTDRSVRNRLLRYPFKLVYAGLHKLCVIAWGIHIDAGARIGDGLYIGHFGGVLIGPTSIGRDCNIAHQVTIGRRADGTPGLPVLGDRVWVGTGSVIFGNLTIGDGVTIGPLTVVSQSLPPRAMVLGNPLRVLQRDYDNSAEIYGSRKVPSGWLRPTPRPQAARGSDGDGH
jgi:serine O-acetyltransferase